MRTKFIASPHVDLWETVATMCLLQTFGRMFGEDDIYVTNPSKELLELAPGKWFKQNNYSPEKTCQLQYAPAYRIADSSTLPYPVVLQHASSVPGIPLTEDIKQFYQPLKLDPIKYVPHDDGYIVLAPFALKKELQMPLPIWAGILRVLQSYSDKVYLLGSYGDRLDEGRLTEDANISDLALQEKLRFLAEASLVVGSANAWTWIAPAWKKPSVVYYPDDMPHDRWWPTYFEHDKLRRLHYPVNKLQMATVLAGTRKLINAL